MEANIQPTSGSQTDSSAAPQNESTPCACGTEKLDTFCILPYTLLDGKPWLIRFLKNPNCSHKRIYVRISEHQFIMRNLRLAIHCNHMQVSTFIKSSEQNAQHTDGSFNKFVQWVKRALPSLEQLSIDLVSQDEQIIKSIPEVQPLSEEEVAKYTCNYYGAANMK